VVFGLAAVALADAGSALLAVLFVAAIASNVSLMVALDQRRTI
jgi:hypothetical protein